MSLVSTEWLATQAADPDIRICDVRWYLPSSGKSGAKEFESGHLPGAVFVDLDGDLAAPDDGGAGRHPLPTQQSFEAAMRRAGIDATTHVVAYDDAGGLIAARLWWLLREYGHDRVSLLDGGITRWKAEGRPISFMTGPVKPGQFIASARPNTTVSLPELKEALGRGALVLDARARERYRGDVEPVDPRPGHIPGVASAPFADNLSEGLFRPAAKLRELWQSRVRDTAEVIASCGSGVTACHLLFALDETGVRPFPKAKLYVGSYSEWSRHRELPVATGDEPGQILDRHLIVDALVDAEVLQQHPLVAPQPVRYESISILIEDLGEQRHRGVVPLLDVGEVEANSSAPRKSRHSLTQPERRARVKDALERQLDQ